MFFQIPKSTPLLSFRTIQRRNMFSRLQAEFSPGLEICFSLLSGCGIEKNIFLKFVMADFTSFP